jgi:hypothetical protein
MRHVSPLWRERTNTPLVRPDFIGVSLQEFRLRVGFIQVPVALFALSCDRSVWEITGSEEMKPWTLGTDYDRPIPRRIAEEAGIPREWFGQKKKAILMAFTHNSTTLHPALAEDYRRCLQEHRCRTHAPRPQRGGKAAVSVQTVRPAARQVACAADGAASTHVRGPARANSVHAPDRRAVLFDSLGCRNAAREICRGDS